MFVAQVHGSSTVVPTSLSCHLWAYIRPSCTTLNTYVGQKYVEYLVEWWFLKYFVKYWKLKDMNSYSYSLSIFIFKSSLIMHSHPKYDAVGQVNVEIKCNTCVRVNISIVLDFTIFHGSLFWKIIWDFKIEIPTLDSRLKDSTESHIEFYFWKLYSLLTFPTLHFYIFTFTQIVTLSCSKNKHSWHHHEINFITSHFWNKSAPIKIGFQICFVTHTKCLPRHQDIILQQHLASDFKEPWKHTLSDILMIRALFWTLAVFTVQSKSYKL